MMSFYLKPPRGIIAYHVLQKCVEERLRFFKSINNSIFPAASTEYLFEDSAFDRSGHFTLRLAAVKDSSFLSFFVSSELTLLKMRLDSHNESLLRIFLKNLIRHAKECLNEDNVSENICTFLNVIVTVVMKMLSKSYRSHVFNTEHVIDEKCKFFILNVPFHCCSSLISQHIVDLKNGYAKIPCQKWKDLMLSFFHTYLRTVVNEMRYSNNVQRALEDERIKSVLLVINQEVNVRNSHVNLTHINEESKYFPLCMQHLQTVLLKNHRLGHEERFNFSLFLKDIGVSLEDSISYWKSEYSKETVNCTTCSHNWQKEERRYVYSIKHLYGLEGSRRTYKTRSCDYMQTAALKPTQEGGCPFKHFDDFKFKRLLSPYLDEGNDMQRILLERSKSPSNACKMFLKVIGENAINYKRNSMNELGSSMNCGVNFNNPVQYFVILKNFNKEF